MIRNAEQNKPNKSRGQTDYAKMSDEELRVKVAELRGFSLHVNALFSAWKRNGKIEAPPNYPADLNAMHEEEKMLKADDQVKYLYHLRDVVLGKYETGIHGISDVWNACHATARQRTVAFCQTLKP